MDKLIPLYSIGVFMAFTLSQSGMVARWRKLKEKGWKQKAFVNGFGAITTGIVLLDVAIEKFAEGAWAVMVLMAILVYGFKKIRKHYDSLSHQLSMAQYTPVSGEMHNTVLLLVPSVHRGLIPALHYARTLSPDCRGVHIEVDQVSTPKLHEKWEKWGEDVPLVILNSPFRSLMTPLMRYLDAVQSERKNHIVTIVVPEFVPTKWWHTLLHGNSGLRLKIALMARRNIVVVNIRYHLSENEDVDGVLEEHDFEDTTHSHPVKNIVT